MAETKQYLLGLDNGGTVTKAVIFDSTGKKISSAKKTTKTIIPRPGYMERDMEELWKINCQCINEAIKQSGLDAQKIAAIAVCGHGKGLYTWGREGRPAYKGILSADNRAWKYPKRWKADGTYDKIRKKICQNLLASQQAALLAWLKDEEPDVYKNLKYVFSVKDYIRFRLTGCAYSELTDISGSGLIDVANKKIDKEILTAYGIEEIFEKIPPLKASSEICGQITEETAKITGLFCGTPVVGGMFDIDACAVATKVLRPEYMCMIAGTWSINEYISPKPVLDSETNMNSLFAIPEYYLIEECSPTSAGNLDWILGLLESKKKISRNFIYSYVNQMVASVEPEDCEVYFLPFLYGSNTHPFGKGAFIGLTSYHKVEHILRAIYEGVVFSHKYHVDKLLKSRVPPKTIRMAGGAINSQVWVQIFADVLGIPIEIVEGDEIGALGCAIAAAIGVGIYKDFIEASESMVKVSAVVYPNPEKQMVYEKKYEKYCHICKALDQVWDEFQI